MDLSISRLGPAKINSPLRLSTERGDRVCNFVSDDERILYDVSLRTCQACRNDPASVPLSFERAGPREHIYFDPNKVRVGIVTCGGLCPGTNDVIRSLVMELHYHYGVNRIYGFKYGYAGLVPEGGYDVIDLTPAIVKNIHHDGGTILGSSRGHQDEDTIVDTLERMGLGILFTIGGDGTLRGAQKIHEEITARNLKISMIGVPKTIDNDISLVEKTFGFETAFSIAIDSIRGAHVEAEGAPNGVGLVKLMGRHSGYIAATAAVAEPDVNCVLIPEIPFFLDGDKGLIPWLRNRLESRGHAVIVVAEGVGQDLLEADKNERDASGNVRLEDIGLFLKRKIASELKAVGVKYSLKYIDPSYIIRSAPANPNDSLFCATLAQNAVHAGLNGRTGMLVGYWNNVFVHVPIREAVAERKLVDSEGELWRSVLESTGQPARWK
ncbi:MAG: ATP-dependent 6-phosphofructokinase [Deltaproteobacteria bacterium]|nr:ATP-dependent 6-phosphofructokinase [Deltaproteobacteria bacterium]MBW1870463.1 ATP-dependent 6-phosphofructokinase [Deltaproteobacteria bacterium]